MRDQPPPPPFSLLRPYNMDSLGTKIHLVELFKSQLLNPSRPSPPPSLHRYVPTVGRPGIFIKVPVF